MFDNSVHNFGKKYDKSQFLPAAKVILFKYVEAEI